MNTQATITSTLRQLPVEIQTLVLKKIFAGQEIWADYSEKIEVAEEDCQWNEPRCFSKRNGTDIVSDTVPIYALETKTTAKFDAWNSLFTLEARVSWECYVTFHFPSTLSLLDVLLSESFPIERRSLIRQIVIDATPLPLYGMDSSSYVTHDLEQALPLITGLQLDTLVSNDVYLPHDDGWGRIALPYCLRGMLASSGWRNLEFMTVHVELKEEEVTSLVAQAEKVRTERNEPDFGFSLPRNKVTTDEHGRITGLAVSAIDESSEVAAEEPLMRVTRGKAANIQHRKSEESTWGVLDFLFPSMSWRQIRLKGKYLVDEGLEDPNRHL